VFLVGPFAAVTIEALKGRSARRVGSTDAPTIGRSRRATRRVVDRLDAGSEPDHESV
jgi:hypothetical protein